MKTKEIAKQYGINQDKFERYLRSVGAGKEGITGYQLDDTMVAGHIEGFKMAQAEEIAKKKAEKQAAEEKQRALASMLITSGFSFDGYRVTKYSGYISGDDCVTMPRDNFWGTNKVSDNLCGSLVKIRRQAIKELKEAAYDLGCNAVIGVDFDYMTMDPQHAAALNVTQTVYEPYVICVTANGNAVVIEKNDELVRKNIESTNSEATATKNTNSVCMRCKMIKEGLHKVKLKDGRVAILCSDCSKLLSEMIVEIGPKVDSI